MPQSRPKSTGPRTERGKKISRQNAIKHGLTAKTWLNSDEQNLYQQLLIDLTEENKPTSTLEQIQIERIASAMTRLQRIHSVEDAMYALKQQQSDDPEIFLDGMRFNESHHKMIQPFGELLAGIYQPPNYVCDRDFQFELLTAELNVIFSVNDIENHLPNVFSYLLDECVIRKCAIKDYLNGVSKGSAFVPSRKANSSSDDEILRAEASNSNRNVTASVIKNYLDNLITEVIKHKGIIALRESYENQRQLIINSALPSIAELNSLHRERVSNERLLSRAIGELIEIKRSKNLLSS